MPHGRTAGKTKTCLAFTDWCLPVRSSQSRPQPAAGYGAGWRGFDSHLRLRLTNSRLFWFGFDRHYSSTLILCISVFLFLAQLLGVALTLMLGFWHSIPLCCMPCHPPDLRLLSSLLAMYIGQCLNRH